MLPQILFGPFLNTWSQYDACNAQYEYDLKCFSEIQESVLLGLMILGNTSGSRLLKAESQKVQQ